MLKSIRIFLIISFLSFAFTACNSLKIPGKKVENKIENYEITPFSTTEENIFQAEIIAFERTLKGNLAVKNYAENHQRLALVSSLGNTLLDMEIKDHKVEIKYIIDDLDKNIIRYKLKKYFGLLMNSNYKIKKTHQTSEGKILRSKFQGKPIFLYLDSAEKLYKIRQASRFKEKVEIQIKENNQVIFQSKELPIQMEFK